MKQTHGTARSQRLRLPARWATVARGAVAVIVLAILVGLAFVPRGGLSAGAAGTSWRWYKTDTHTHSVVSSEAEADIGILGQSAKDQGYDFILVTDHNNASSFQINNLTANHMVFEDDYTRWTSATYGLLSSTTNALATTPVNSGAKSLHLKATSSSYGEAFVWTKRGPNFRSGDIILKFSVYPVRLDPGSGVYVSVSVGGDQTVEPPVGYTTQAGVVSPGKSSVLVWQLGSPRAASSDPNARVLTYPLSYTLNTWNTYTINVSAALADIPSADRPLDYDAVTFLKMASAGAAGTSDAYFDTYSIDASAPVAPADEFVYRTGAVDDFDTGTFKVFPSLEMGQRAHSQRFNFGITDPSQFASYTYGTDGILPTQQTGYPAMLNHPGLPGGVTQQEAIVNQAYGADIMEVRDQVMIDTWDAILQQGVPLIGSWSSDTHTKLTKGKPATYIYAPALDFDELMQSLFEGRVYNAGNDFSGRVIFNLDSVSQEPYPARYPVYVPDTQTSASVHLKVTAGFGRGYSIRWYRNGVLVFTDSAGGSSYDATKSFALDGPFTYIRAEVRSSSTSIKALTQPIFFVDVPSLPSGSSYHVDGVTTADGRGYTKIMTKGITATSWSAASQVLSINLVDTAGALVELSMSTASAPSQVKVDGTPVSAAASLADFQAGTNSSWYYDGAAKILHLKVLHAASTAGVLIEFSSTGDTQAPTIPTNLTATAVSAGQVDLSWSASTDDVGVTGYTIRRDGSVLTTTGSGVCTAGTCTYSDLTVAPSTTYTYTVEAFDASGNPSGESSPASATTPAPPTSFTFTPVADTYVNESSPTANYGASTALRADASPINRSYLRFSVQGLGGPVKSATLRVYANSSSGTGHDVRGVADNTWGERTITYANAPTVDAIVTGSSGGFSVGSWTTVDVTPLITGNGTFSLAITTPSSAAISYASRESGANAPQLVVETQ